MVPWQWWQRSREHLEAQVLLIANAVAAALDHADLVVQPFDKSERDLVVRRAVGCDALPLKFDQRGELLERLESLPAKCLSPVLEKLPGLRFAPIFPELRKLLLQHVGGLESLIRRQERW